jgi:glutaredoxin-like protein
MEKPMLLSPKNRLAIQERLQRMEAPVRLIHFTQALDCPSCSDAERLLAELAPLSPKLSLQVLNLHVDRAQAAAYGIEHAPATVIEGASDYGIRIYGLPAGYEFAVLNETILLVSSARSDLDPQLSAALAPLAAPVHLQVFSTPTCPYCPGMALLAAQMAIESELVSADLYDATEFPELVRAHNISGVPKTILNGAFSIDGAVPGHMLIEYMLRATLSQGSVTQNQVLEERT